MLNIIKNFLNKNFNYILIISVILLCFYRSPHIFLNGRFLAEEGSFWFSNSYSLGPIYGLFQMYFGTQYFNLWANLSSVIASFFPLNFAPLATVYLAFLVQAYLYFYIVFGNSEFLKSKKDKLIGILIVLVSPPMVPGVWLATNLSQIYFTLITILIFFNEDDNNNFFNKLEPYILLIGGLSSVLVCILSPFFYLKYKKKNKKKNLFNFIFITIATLPQFILFIYIKFSGLEILSDGPRYILSFDKFINFCYNVIAKSVFGRELTQLLFTNLEFLQNYSYILIVLFFVVFIFMKTTLKLVKQDNIFKYLFLFLILNCILALVGAKFEEVQGRYAVIPGVLFLFCIYRFSQISNGFLKIFSVFFILISISTGIYEFKNNNIQRSLLICGNGCPNWKEEIIKWEIDEDYPLKIWQYPIKNMNLKKRLDIN